jgi:predicted nucleotidyltransferase
VLKSYFSNTSQQRILAFLANHPSRSYFDKEVREATELSSGATNQALRELAEEGYIQKEKKGRMSFYSVDLSNPLIRQLKILLNITSIYPLIEKLRDRSVRIILFGSTAQGTNMEDSDIDLFVLTNTPKEVTKLVNDSNLAEKTQLVIKKPVDWAALKNRDPIFYEEVERGLILWEAK